MPQHFSKRISRPFRKVLHSMLSSGRKRILYLECGHTLERYLCLGIPKKVRCMECVVGHKAAKPKQ